MDVARASRPQLKKSEARIQKDVAGRQKAESRRQKETTRKSSRSAKILSVNGPTGKSAPQSIVEFVTDWLYEVGCRMLRGIFRFTFIRVPVWIWEVCPTWFKVGRAIGVISLWILLTFGPASVVMMTEKYHNSLLPLALVTGYECCGRAVNVGLFAWSVLAVAGSAWGLVNLRRRR